MKCLNTLLAICTLILFCDDHLTQVGNGAFARKGKSTKTRDESPVRFWIYSNPADHQQVQEIKLNDHVSLKAAQIVPDSQVTIIIHGFNTNFSTPKISTQVLKNAYLLSGYDNVIAVDWYKLAQLENTDPIEFKSYTFAVGNVPTVGRTVAKFCQFLLTGNAISSPSQIHLVGHSLGSHVSGIAGSTFRALRAGSGSAGETAIGRITGLDPAFPEYFEKHINKGRRLDKSDARFVDVLHTNIGMRGYPYPCGHVDFYANCGGPFQPGCLTPMPGEPDPVPQELVTGICSHRRAYWFFAQTISNDDKWYGCQCQQQVLQSNDTTTPVDHKCNRLASATKQCMRRTLFGQYASDRARGSYDVEIDLNDASKYYE